MIDTAALTGGLSLPAYGLNEALKGWATIEGSDGFVPAYKLGSMPNVTPLISELVDKGVWTAVARNGKHYGYVINEADPVEAQESFEESLVSVSALAQSLVRDELENGEEEQSEGAKRPSRRGSPEPYQQFRKEITDEEITEGFDEFLNIFHGSKDSPRNFDAFKRAVEDVRSVSKILDAAYAYTGFESAHRFLAGELYLDTDVFRRDN